MMVLDLDPSDDDFAKVKRAAKDARRLLEEMGLTAVRPDHGLARAARLGAARSRRELRRGARDRLRPCRGASPRAGPSERTTEQRKAKRGDRVFLDVARNAYGQTVVAPYSVRARPEASVATPVAWEELSSLTSPRRHTVGNLFRRLARKPDPWAGIGESAQSLAPARSKLAALAG